MRDLPADLLVRCVDSVELAPVLVSRAFWAAAQSRPEPRVVRSVHVLTSIRRFNWAESIGCPWEGRQLTRGAARAGSWELLDALGQVYVGCDADTVWHAAAADQAAIVEAYGLDPYRPSHLYAAGPRVQKMAQSGQEAFLRPLERDFRRILDDAGPVLPIRAAPGYVEAAGTTPDWTGPGWTAPDWTVQFRTRVKVPPLASSVELPRGYTMVYDVRPVGPIRIVGADVNGYEDDNPWRVWFTHGMQASTLRIRVEWLVHGPASLEFTAVVAPPEAVAPYAARAADDTFLYTDGFAGPKFLVTPPPEPRRAYPRGSGPLLARAVPAPSHVAGVPLRPGYVTAETLDKDGLFQGTIYALMTAAVSLPSKAMRTRPMTVAVAGVARFTGCDFVTELEPVGRHSHLRLRVCGVEVPIQLPLVTCRVGDVDLEVETDAAAVRVCLGVFQMCHFQRLVDE